MREIKFRAKAKFSGTIGSDKWLYSSLMRLDAPTHRLNLAGQDCELETLGQFTGLHDKNGKEIYEGDILHTNEADWIAKVIWNYDGFMLTGLNNTGFSCSPDYVKCEVIGNIHENTEFING